METEQETKKKKHPNYYPSPVEVELVICIMEALDPFIPINGYSTKVREYMCKHHRDIPISNDRIRLVRTGKLHIQAVAEAFEACYCPKGYTIKKPNYDELLKLVQRKAKGAQVTTPSEEPIPQDWEADADRVLSSMTMRKAG